MGRMKHEVYAKYYERKMETLKKSRDAAALVVGLIFLAIGIVFTVIWYVKFYQVPV
jgi:archaellum biogenesis protein FlaJ (TadC family)